MSSPLGIIAGLGDLPVDLARRAVDEGRGVHVLRIAGFEEPRLKDFPGETVSIGEIGRQIKSLKAAGCEEIVFAGVVKRPDFSNIKLAMRGTLLLPKVVSAARNGDDALLRVLVETFEKEGFRIIGAEDAASDLRAPSGLIAGPEPSESQMADRTKGARIAAAKLGADAADIVFEDAGGRTALEAKAEPKGPRAMAAAQQSLADPDGHALAVALPRTVLNLATLVFAILWVNTLTAGVQPTALDRVIALAFAAVLIWLIGAVGGSIPRSAKISLTGFFGTQEPPAHKKRNTVHCILD